MYWNHKIYSRSQVIFLSVSMAQFVLFYFIVHNINLYLDYNEVKIKKIICCNKLTNIKHFQLKCIRKLSLFNQTLGVSVYFNEIQRFLQYFFSATVRIN